MTTAARTAAPDILELLKTITGGGDADLAERVGMTRATFRHKRIGGSELSLSELVSFSDAFGIPLEVFAARPDVARQWLIDHWAEVKSSYLSEYFGNTYSAQLDLLEQLAA